MELPDGFKELHQQFITAQYKYTYFLLAAAAAAVAYALKLTSSSILSYSMIPLGMAVLSWGLSFFFGCRQLKYIKACISLDFGLLKILNRKDLEIGTNPQSIANAIDKFMEAFESNANKASRFESWQFWLLIIGALFFIAGHITEMIIRTI
jgi:hypothetical protein